MRMTEDEKEMQEILKNALIRSADEIDSVFTFEEYQHPSSNAGLVVNALGRTFYITVKQSS